MRGTSPMSSTPRTFNRIMLGWLNARALKGGSHAAQGQDRHRHRAGSGMGRAGAIRFAKEGAKVAVVDLDGASVERW